jgi:siroheme decarboxylase
MADIDVRDREVLALLQSEVPLASTPYALVGQALDMSEKEVIKRIERLKREGVIRRICGHFDARMLGYRTCLVAARVDPERIEQSAAAINLHPAVTQNYQRNHEFNLWFTIALPPDSRLGLERTVEVLAEEAQCDATRLLPTLKLLKSSGADSFESSPNEAGTDGLDEERESLTESEIEMVRLLQRDLPAQPRPFDVLATAAGVSGDELLEVARTFIRRQQLRRFAALVESRKPSFSATTMGVWQVEPADIDAFGARMADFKAVSHCYLRPVYSDWRYNVFTTVHGRSVDECESVLSDIAAATGVNVRAALFPTRELKRARIAFFSAEVQQWESLRADERSASAVS